MTFVQLAKLRSAEAELEILAHMLPDSGASTTHWDDGELDNIYDQIETVERYIAEAIRDL